MTRCGSDWGYSVSSKEDGYQKPHTTKMLSPRSSLLLSSAFLFTIGLTYLILCPHSKVEESFQLQATHDLFYYGISPAIQSSFLGQNVTLPYDHLQYPGVVPRTFTGPVILATLCQLVRLVCFPIVDIATRPMLVQFLARFFLFAINFMGWVRLASSVDRRKGGHLGAWLLLTTACQFHLPFYASRMLPNTFALAVILHAYSFWIEEKTKIAAALVVVATAVFRCDVLLLLASLGLSWLLLRQLSIVEALKIGIISGIFSLALTVPIDSLLWQRPLWPEGEVFFYNTVLGKSSNWGTSPWHWYFSSALPKSMLLTALLVPICFIRLPALLVVIEQRFRTKQDHLSIRIVETEWLKFVIPVVGFVGIYSFLGHKEMRFIFPALPILNLAAAAGMAQLSQIAFPEKGKPVRWIGRIAFLGGVLLLSASLGGSIAFVAVSRLNYPGGVALSRLTDHIRNGPPDTPNIEVFVDVASAMTGVSLFGQREAEMSTPGIPWNFDKGGYEEEHSIGTDGLIQFSHMLSETPDVSPDFVVVDTIQGMPSLDIRRLRIDTKPALYILERKN